MEVRNEDENTNLLRSVDWFTIVLYLIMVVAGAVSIYAATYDYDKASMFDLRSPSLSHPISRVPARGWCSVP